MVLVPLREVRRLSICGLEYRVVFASAVEVPALADNEGWTSTETNTIYLDASVPRTRLRDALVHEVLHAVLEASGLGSLLATALKQSSQAYEDFEETLVRLAVPHVLRLIEENGKALIEPPRVLARTQARSATKAKSRGRRKR